MVWLVSGLCGDDGHKSRRSAVEYANAKYGPQRFLNREVK